MGIGLVFAIANMFLLNKEVDDFKKRVKESKSDIAYYKKSYIKYYDKYIKIVRPEIVH